MSISYRSVTVTCMNRTGETLTRKSDHLEHGGWKGGQPPSSIAPGATATWASESSTIFGAPTTGTEGTAIYQIGGDAGHQVVLYWDNPLAGTNSYKATTTGNYGAWSTGGAGNEAAVRFVVATNDVPMDLDLVWNSTDPNGFPLNPRWGAQVNEPGVVVDVEAMAALTAAVVPVLDNTPFPIFTDDAQNVFNKVRGLTRQPVWFEEGAPPTV